MALTISDDKKFIKVTDGGDTNDRYSKENLSITSKLIENTEYLVFSDNDLSKVYKYSLITSPAHTSVDDLIEQIQSNVENIFYMNATERTTSLINSNLTTVQTNQGTQITQLSGIDTILSGLLTSGEFSTFYSDFQNEMGTSNNIYSELQSINTALTGGSNVQMDYELAADMELIPNVKIACTHGLRKGVTGANYLYIYQGGIDPYQFPTTNVACQVSSTSANDTSAGTGGRTVYIEGYLLDGTFKSETVTLNGQTAVNCVNQYYRATKFQLLTAGATTYNEGTIYLGWGTVTAGANNKPLYGLVIGYSNNFNSLIHIPTGKTGYIREYALSVSIAGNNDKPALVQLMHRTNNGVIRVIDERGVRQEYHGSSFCQDIVGPADIWFQGKPVTPGDNIDIQTDITVLIK